MMMARILCLVLPLKSHLHLHGTLAGTLRERGHEVIFAAMADAQPLISSYGFPCLTLFSERLPAGLMQDWLVGEVSRTTWKQKLAFYLNERRKLLEHESFVEYLIQGGYGEFLDVVAQARPDLILVDNGLHTYWALMARRTGLPCVYTSSHMPLVEDPITPPLGSLLEPARDLRSAVKVKLAWKSYFVRRWVRRQMMRLAVIPDSISNFRRLARATGCPRRCFNTRTELFPQLDFPIVIFCPEEFEFPESRTRAGVHFTEALVNPSRPEPDFDWERLAPGKKLIFCSLGSVAFVPHFFQTVLDSVAREDQWQLVLNIGPVLRRADFARVPDNAILVNGAPQIGLLQRAAAMIHHGGINSVRECAYFGVPQFIFPLFFDQHGSAARIRFHGLGSVGRYEMTSDELHSALAGMLTDSGVRSRTQQMSAVFRRKEEERVAARTVEGFLDGSGYR